MELKNAKFEEIMRELESRFPCFIFFGAQPDADTSGPNRAIFKPWARARSAPEAMGFADLFKQTMIQDSINFGIAGPYALEPKKD